MMEKPRITASGFLFSRSCSKRSRGAARPSIPAAVLSVVKDAKCSAAFDFEPAFENHDGGKQGEIRIPAYGVRRLGRKTRIPEQRRSVLWSIFEKVRKN